MRFLVTLGLSSASFLILAASSASAEFPLAIRATFGPGFGYAAKGGSGTGPIGGIAAVDLIWRRGDGRGVSLTLDAAGVAFPGGYSTVSSGTHHLHSSVHETITIGPERHRSGAGKAGNGHWGLGVGRIHEEYGSGDVRDYHGLALTAATGIRFVAEPGPLGFACGFRTSHVFAPQMRAHVIAVVIGFTIEPLDLGEPVMASH